MSAEATTPQLHAVAGEAPEPAARRRLVDRTRLVRALVGIPGGSLAAVVAPAGYGKTTLLAQWAEHDDRPFTWLDADSRHDDPAQLLAAIAAVGPRPGSVLVLDDVHLLRAPAAAAALAHLAQRLDPTSVLALASRSALALPLGRLRTQERVLELSGADLAMTAPEATLLLRRAGLRLQAEDVETLVRRTEGWPAGLQLAALSLRAQDDVAAAIAGFSGNDHLVAEYLRHEVLAGLSTADLAFLTETSVLGCLSGPSCDAVVARADSVQVLRRLARRNVMVIPLDRAQEQFRQHALLGDMLRGELRRAGPTHAVMAHRRASGWHEEHGDVDGAIAHAIAGADAARTDRLVWSVAGAYMAAGRAEALAGWLGHFRDDEIAARPALALTAAAGRLVRGERDDAERWSRAAQRVLSCAPSAVSRSLAVGAAVIRAAVAREGVARMGEDALRAHAIEPHDGPWQAFACLLAGTARHLAGDRGGARTWLEDGARTSAPPAPAIAALCLAQLALLALERDDRAEAAELLRRARARIAGAGLEDLPMCALVHAASAYAHAEDGEVARARGDVVQARRLHACLPDFAPWYDAEVRIALARAELRLSDAAQARAHLAAAARDCRRVPDAPVLAAWIDDGWASADRFAAGSVAGPATLTIAELRVLRFLPSHLSFREIALRLHVSANTVKTQAHAVYRKLDASSRSEAVGRARDVGLVEG